MTNDVSNYNTILLLGNNINPTTEPLKLSSGVYVYLAAKPAV